MSEAGRVGDVLPTLVDAVQDYIRDRIVSGEYPPGHRLVERELADATGASRIPVREAIRGLASERFVTQVPRRGAIVAQLRPGDLDEIFEVREALEVQECVLAARKATQEDIERMRAHVRAAEDALAHGDHAGANEANAAFHDVLEEMSHNAVLTAVLEPLKNRLRWILRQNTDQASICREHAEMAEAIAARDVAAARRLALRHVATSKQLALAVLFRQPDEQTPTALSSAVEAGVGA